MPTLDSSPETLTIEVEIATVWTNLSTDYVIRETVQRESATSAGKPAQTVYNVVQKGGGLAIHEGQRVRIKNDDTGHWIFRGYIDAFIGADAGGNEKLWQLTCTDASQDLDNYNIPQGYVVTAGTTDQDAITDAFTLYCPAIAPSGVNLIITSLAEIDASYMTMRQFLTEVQKQANAAQKPDYQVHPDALGAPQLSWFDWNNNTHTPVLTPVLIDTTTPDSTHIPYENFELHRDAGKLITSAIVYNPTTGAEGVIDGSIDVTGPHTFTASTGDILTTSTNHGLTTANSVYMESTGTLPTGLVANTEYWVKTVPLTTTMTLARHPVVAQEVGFTNTDDRVWLASHPYAVGDEVVFATTGALPTGITAGTRYYVVTDGQNFFQISTSAGGAVLNFTTDGTGTNTVTPGVLDITSTGSGTHTLWEVRFDSMARDAYLYLGYQKAGEPFKSDIATTNHECRLEARARIHALGGTRVTATLDIYENIDPSDLGGPRRVKLQNTLWGLSTSDPPWPIVRSSLDYSDGTAVWHLELGDRFIEFGDHDLIGQTGGNRFIGAGSPPAAPTWPSGTSWILENTPDYNYPGGTRFRINLNPNTEANMWRYLFVVIDITNSRTYFPPAIYHSQTSIDLTYLHLPTLAAVQIVARAQNTSGLISPYSAQVSTVMAGAPYSTDVRNFEFEEPDPFDSTKARWWATSITGAGGTAVLNTADAMSGAQCYRLGTTAAGRSTRIRIQDYRLAVSKGQVWTFSVLAKSSPSASCFNAKVYWYKEDGTASSTPSTTLASGVALTGSPIRKMYEVPVPSDASLAEPEIENTSGTANVFMYVDGGRWTTQIKNLDIGEGEIDDAKLATLTDATKPQYNIEANPQVWTNNATDGVGRLSWDNAGSGTLQLQAPTPGEKLKTEAGGGVVGHTLGGAVTDVAQLVEATASHTADLAQWQKNGVTKASIDIDGNIVGGAFNSGVIKDRSDFMWAVTPWAGLSTVLWTPANQLTGADASAVASLPDAWWYGGLFNLAQATTGNKPQLKRAIQNGLNAVRFDGTNDYLLDSTFDKLNGVNKFELWIVFKTTDMSGNRGLLWKAGSELRIQLFTSNLYVGAGGSGYGHFAFTDTTSYHVLTLEYDGTTLGDANRLKAWLDGVSKTITFDSSIGTTVGTTSGLYLGADSGLAVFHQGDVGDLVIVAGLLSTEGRRRVNAMLGAKWGVTITQ